MNNTSEKRQTDRQTETETDRDRDRQTETDRDRQIDRQTETGVGVGFGEQTKQLLDFTECYVNQRTGTHTYRQADTDIQTHRHTDS